jgi:alpha/beta superfamily hydrolase
MGRHNWSSPMSKTASTPLSRRHLFAGAGTAGALAAAAAVLPLQREAAPVVVVAKPAPEAGGGYQLTAHVQRYYQTAKV